MSRHLVFGALLLASCSSGSSDGPLPNQGPRFETDDFNSCAGLRPHWTVLDPLADSTFEVFGVGTDAAQLTIGVPGGVGHASIDTNLAPRVMQTVSDSDVTLEVSFESEPAFPGQFQGLFFQQDPLNWIQFELRGDESGLIVCAQETTAGETVELWAQAFQTPLYQGFFRMRVERVGDSWIQEVSADGLYWQPAANFLSTKKITGIGIAAGNGGADPQPFTARVDYIQNSDDPLLEEDGNIEFGPFTLTHSVLGQGTLVVDPDLSQYVCGEVAELEAQAAPNWKFDHWAGDASGSQNPLRFALEADSHVVAVFVDDAIPPVISNLQVVPGIKTALLTWTTNEPATSRVDFGPTSLYGSSVESLDLVTAHSIALSDLDPATIYHFSVQSADGAGHAASSPDSTFETTPAPELASDDFSRFNLDRNLWAFVNPLNTGRMRMVGVGTSDARVELSVPAGIEHDPYGTNFTPRLMQDVQNDDFDIALRYESPLDLKYQIQGVIIEEDDSNWMRFDLYFDGVRVMLYAGTNVDGVPATAGTGTVWEGTWDDSPLYLRVTRTGDLWSASTSFDGVTWDSPVAAFTHVIDVAKLGPFVGNARATSGIAPAHTAAIDWFFDWNAPIPGEDSVVDPDDEEPYVYHAEAVAVTGDTATIAWHSDESASGWVEYGQTLSFEMGSTPVVGPSWDPSVQISGLLPETDYFFRVLTDDVYLQRTITQGHAFRTDSESGGGGSGSGDGPGIEVWYGHSAAGNAVRQRFGHLGQCQTFINITGRIDVHTSPLTNLEYTLNGGTAQFLNVGPDSRRLYGEGDFNIEIAFADLLPGDNDVFITAQDAAGGETLMHVIAEYTPATGPTDFVIDPTSSDDLEDLVQVVDGLWTATGPVIRPLERGYDRLLAVGDVLHENYEVTVELTAYSIDAEGYDFPSNGPAVGMGLRWTGHTGTHQPRRGFWPTGAFAWYRWSATNERFELRTNEYTNGVFSPEAFTFGEPYTFKARVSTQVDGTPLFRFKYWQSAATEPATWNLEVAGEVDDPTAGSILILSHHVDVDFGTISVVAIPPGS